MLKIIYPICCGIDVHKKFVVACMESTGKYWIPAYNILEDISSITLAHPKYVRAIRGKKT